MRESNSEVHVFEASGRGSAEVVGKLTEVAEGGAGYTIVVDDARRPWALATSGPEGLIEWEVEAQDRVEAGEPSSPVEIVVCRFERGIVVEVEGALGFVPRQTQLYTSLLQQPAAVSRFLASADIIVPGNPEAGCISILCQDCSTENCVIAYVPGMLCVNDVYEHELVP